MLRAAEHDLSNRADDASGLVMDGYASHHTRFAPHFLHVPNFRFASLRNLVKPRVLDDFRHVPANALPGRQSEEALMYGAQIADHAFRIDHGQGFIRIGQEMLEDVTGKWHRGDEIEQDMVGANGQTGEYAPAVAFERDDGQLLTGSHH